MYHIAEMYSDARWSLESPEEVYAFFWRDEVHHNYAIVVEAPENGVRAWIGTDFMQRYEELFGRAEPVLESELPVI